MMRRAFIRSLVGALAAGSSPVAKAQRTRVWRIGVLFAGPGTPASNLGALKKSFEGLGYVEDVNAAFVVPSADGWIERLPELAAELVGLGVDVLITGGSEATRAAKQASASNVIVFQDGVIRSRRGSSAASRAPVPIFPYCRSRPVRRSSTSAAEWSRRVLRRRICAPRDNERAGSIPLLRGSLSSRPDRRFLCTEPLPVAQ